MLSNAEEPSCEEISIQLSSTSVFTPNPLAQWERSGGSHSPEVNRSNTAQRSPGWQANETTCWRAPARELFFFKSDFILKKILLLLLLLVHYLIYEVECNAPLAGLHLSRAPVLLVLVPDGVHLQLQAPGHLVLLPVLLPLGEEHRGRTHQRAAVSRAGS